MKLSTLHIILALALTASTAAAQTNEQRRITPVKPNTNTILRPAKGTKEEVVQRYLDGDRKSVGRERV